MQVSNRVPVSAFSAMIVALVSLCVAAAPLAAESGASLELRSELYRSERLRSRAIYETPGFLLLGIDDRRIDDRRIDAGSAAGTGGAWRAGTQTFGFHSPLLTLGPVDLEGVLRHLHNPLGYGPTSGSFYERSGLALDRGFDAGRRRGAALRSPDERFQLLMYGGSAYGGSTIGGSTIGGLISIPGGVASPLVELLLSVTENPRDDPGDSWYPDRPSFPGGGLVNAAVRLSRRGSSAGAALSCGASGSAQLRPGGFGMVNAFLGSGPVETALVLGLSSRSYFTPEGSWCTRAVQAGGRVAVSPFGPLQLGVEGDWRREHPGGRNAAFLALQAAGDGRTGRPGERPERRTWSLWGECAWFSGRTASLATACRWDRVIEADEHGEEETEDRYRLRQELSVGELDLSAAYTRQRPARGGAEQDLVLRARLRTAPSRGTAGPPGPVEIELEAGGLLRLPAVPVWSLRLEAGPGDSRLSMAWEQTDEQRWRDRRNLFTLALEVERACR